MDTTRRTAGLGLLAYGIGTPVAFVSIGAPGGDYSETTVAGYVSRGHWPTAIALAYLGAFASLGLLVFASRMRSELRSASDGFWALSVAATAAAVVGWFLLGGIAVAFAEGGAVMGSVPHPVVYLVGELAVLLTGCASAFFVGVAAIVLAGNARLPRLLRVASSVAGVCGVLAGFFFPLFLFWLWAIAFGSWAVLSGTTRVPSPVAARQLV